MEDFSINFEWLAQICRQPGISGYEHRIRAYLKEQLEGKVDELFTDAMGNLYAIKKGKQGNGKKMMLAAHIDEIGFMVNHIDDKGFVRFHPIGGFDPKTLTSMQVMVHSQKDLPGVMGAKPIHIMTPEEKTKAPAITDFFVDLGLPKEEVLQLVSIGDAITRRQDLAQIGNCLSGKSLDNRLSVYLLMELLKNIDAPAYDLYAVFTVQEEVGLRGAQVAAHHINPDYGIAIDVTVANDIPGSQPHQSITQLGKGAAIKLYDSSTLCDVRMINFLKQTANKHQIAWQPEVLTAGGTDTAGLQRMGKHGAIAGAISIPLRYVHQTTEMAHTNDIKACFWLLLQAVREMDDFVWTH